MRLSLVLLCGFLVSAAILVLPQPVRSVPSGPSPHRRRSRSPEVRPDTGSALRSRVLGVARRVRRRLGGADGEPADATSEDVLGLVEDLATQVRAGAAPDAAWRVVAELRQLDEAAGERPRETLRRLASQARAPAAVAALHAAWALSEDVGAPLADVLQTVAGSIRQDAEVEADIEAALAAPRSTARLLAALPLAGIGLGELIGAHPVQVLLTTAIGRVCAVVGLLLAFAGQWWTRRLVSRTTALL